MQKKYTTHLEMGTVEIHFAYVKETREEVSVDARTVREIYYQTRIQLGLLLSIWPLI